MQIKKADEYTDGELMMIGRAAASMNSCVLTDIVTKINDEQIQCMKTWERAKHDVEWMERVKTKHQKNIRHFMKNNWRIKK